MISELVQFAIAHPIAVLVGAGVLAGGWFVSGCISVMPPLPPDAGWWLTFAWRCAQVLGAGFDKVGHIAQQSTAFKQVETSLQTGDATGIQKLETSKVITQTAEPTPGVAP